MGQPADHETRPLDEAELRPLRRFRCLIIRSPHVGWGGVRNLLETEWRVPVVGVVTHTDEGVALARMLQPDAILVAGDLTGAPIASLAGRLRQVSQGSRWTRRS